MKNRGFTLVELLAVIVILAVILVIAVPQISSVVANQKADSFRSGVRLFKKAAELLVAQGTAPTTGGSSNLYAATQTTSADYTITVVAGSAAIPASHTKIDSATNVACGVTPATWEIRVAPAGTFAGTGTSYYFCVAQSL